MVRNTAGLKKQMSATTFRYSEFK